MLDIENLFINLYFNNEIDIIFEDLQCKLIDFYFDKENNNYINIHFIALNNSIEEIELKRIYEKSRKNIHSNNYKLNIIIEFILSSYGTNYLRNIFYKYKND